MDFLAIIAKTIITKYSKDIFTVIRPHMLTSGVYCSIYSTFQHNPRNRTNYNNIKFKKNHNCEEQLLIFMLSKTIETN